VVGGQTVRGAIGRPGSIGEKRGRTRRRRRRRVAQHRPGGILARTAVEAVAIGTGALVAVIAGLGRLAEQFAGSSLWLHILPFAAGVLVLGLLIALALCMWLILRRWIGRLGRFAPAAVASAIGAGALWFTGDVRFETAVANLRLLVGGSTEAARVTLAHQVFAAYRRSELRSLQRTLERGREHEASIQEAAAAFAIEPELLAGVAVAESSFLPRTSADGGRGLFQLTAVPAVAEAAARRRLGVDRLDPRSHRHDAFVAAATLRQYLDQMRGDLFLGLLAYNIGPRNGGLLSIMRQYGARDFVTIQPYLQQLPRDYPIRVLTAALAYRLWRRDGRLPRYEEGDNAQRIQRAGIPGLSR
jgi:hypothetical protein